MREPDQGSVKDVTVSGSRLSGSAVPGLFPLLQLPPFLVYLWRAGYGKRIRRDIHCDCRTCCYQRIASDCNRGHELNIASDKDPVSDCGLVLSDSIIITGYGSTPDIDVAPYFGITEIGQVRCLRSLSHDNLLGLHKVSDLDVSTKIRSRPKMGHRAY